MQAKVKELDDLTTQQASQIATLREELQGSLVELDQVSLLAYYTRLSSTYCPWKSGDVRHVVTSQPRRHLLSIDLAKPVTHVHEIRLCISCTYHAQSGAAPLPILPPSLAASPKQ